MWEQVSYRMNTQVLACFCLLPSNIPAGFFPDLQHLLLMESGPFRPAMLSLLFPRPGLAAGLSQSVSQGQGFILGVHPAQARVQLCSWLGKILLFRGFVFMVADCCWMLSSLV